MRRSFNDINYLLQFPIPSTSAPISTPTSHLQVSRPSDVQVAHTRHDTRNLLRFPTEPYHWNAAACQTHPAPVKFNENVKWNGERNDALRESNEILSLIWRLVGLNSTTNSSDNRNFIRASSCQCMSTSYGAASENCVFSNASHKYSVCVL